ncbi:MAG: hypothetical protein ABSG31_15355 [Tepidisphaeraceae bacterium]|jgi:alginate O-acetyltransferase complex protein AlgJ
MKADVPNDLSILRVEHAGHGTIGRKTAWALAIVFMVMISLPGIYQFYFEETTLKHWQFVDLLVQTPTAESLHHFEDNLTDQSRLDRWVRHTYGMITTGNAIPPKTMLKGYDGFLYTTADVRIFNSYSLDSPAPSPAATIFPAIMDFQAQLGQRGIHLMLLPIPMKLMIYPETMALDYRASDGPAYPPGYVRWLAEARARGLDVLDLTQVLWDAKSKISEPVFWKTDSHMSYAGRQFADDVIAEHLRPMVEGMRRTDFDVGNVNVDIIGDFTFVITRGFGSARYPDLIFQSRTPMRIGAPLVAGNDAPILLLGDSYAALGNTEGYALADDLMIRLGAEIQSIGWPGDALRFGRAKLAGDPAILEHKKLVIWEFQVDAMWNNWEKINLGPGVRN